MTDRFDVFLSHNSRDKAVVERIAERLKRERLEPWLDVWELVPGADWQRGLADGLASFRYVAGRWIDEDRMPGVSGNIRSMAETADGTLWLGETDRSVVIRLSFRNWFRPNYPYVYATFRCAR